MLNMGQFSKVLQLLIMHTSPQQALDCRPGLGNDVTATYFGNDQAATNYIQLFHNKTLTYVMTLLNRSYLFRKLQVDVVYLQTKTM